MKVHNGTGPDVWRSKRPLSTCDTRRKFSMGPLITDWYEDWSIEGCHSIVGVFSSQLIRYSRACSSYECFILRARRLSSKLLKQGYLRERLKSSFRKFYGRYGDLLQQYEVSLSRMLNDILILDQQWLPNQSDFPPISWPWYRAWPSPIMSGFHGAFATGVACKQGTLTLPDTWFRPPFWDLLMLQLLRPNFSNLPCLYSTFLLEYPFVLSRFCLITSPW